MQLIKRVNYTILPVIIGGFLLAWVGAYYATYSLYYLQMESLVEREVAYFYKETGQEIQAAATSLNNVLSSPEMLGYLNDEDNLDFKAYALESALYQMLKKTHDTNKQIENIHVLGPSEKILVAATIDDPFADNSLPPGVLEIIKVMQTADKFIPTSLLVEDGEGSFSYILTQPFSPGLLITDRFTSKSSNLHFGISSMQFSPLTTLRQGITEFFGKDFELHLIPKPSGGSRYLLEYSIETEGGVGNDLMVSTENNILKLQIKINEEVISAQLFETKWLIGAVALAVALIAFFILRRTINLRIVKPIKVLVENIRKLDDEGSVHLGRMEGTDEVSELNNAYVGLMEDIQRLASFDPLTGLANRRRFNSVLKRQLYQAKASSRHVALMFIDLDNFKRVNDQYGHAVGDRLLKVFAERLIDTVRPTDEVAVLDKNDCARLAGDEFAVMLSLSKVPDHRGVQKVADRILALFHDGFEVDGIIHNVHASIGIALYPDDGDSAEALLQYSDATMYHAKKSGKNRYHFFDEDISTELDSYRYIENKLFNALANKDFKLVYMPIFNSQGTQVEGAEVLLRCPPLGSEGIGPDKFIPVAESTGLIKKIDLWVLETAFRQLVALQLSKGFTGIFAINISAQELHNERFPEEVEQLMKRYEINPAAIELELTETSLVNIDASSAKVMAQLKATGVSLSLDDFGTGYTAFNQLGSYAVDCLKIDRSFVGKLGQTDTDKKPMVDVILTLAKMYDLRVVAEGVETLEQMQYLQSRGCDQMQGYYLSKPLEWDEMCALVSTEHQEK